MEPYKVKGADSISLKWSITQYLQGKACNHLCPFPHYQGAGCPLDRELAQYCQFHNSDLEDKYPHTRLTRELKSEIPHCSKTL